MSSFDVAISITGDGLNQAAADIYQALYSSVFTGSTTVNQYGIQEVAWNVGAPPVFNLAPAVAPGEGDGLPFTIDLALVTMTLTAADGSQDTIPLQQVTTDCVVQVNGNEITFLLQQITVNELPDPADQFFVSNVIIPSLKESLQGLLTGLTIPPFNLQGLALSTPSLNITDNLLVAAVNLASKGAPGPVSLPVTTGQPFFIFISPDLLQAAADNSHSQSGGSGSKGSHWAGVDWKYTMAVTDPKVSIENTQLQIDFSLSGSVAATAWLLDIPIPFSFDITATPSPSATCDLVPSDGQIAVVTADVSTFTVLVTPSGSIPEKILGWMVEVVVETVAASASLIVSQFLGGIRFNTITIPTFSETIAGTTVTFAPAGLSPVAADGYIAFGGTLVVS